MIDQVLVVDSDKKSLVYLRAISISTNLFNVLAVPGMEEAIAVLRSENISVVVINHLDSADIDGLELLAHVSRNYPSMPCIVTTSYGKPWFKNKVGRNDAIYFLKKPFNNGSLVSAVFVALSMRDENEVSDRATVRSYLPLIELEQKTCGLSVATRKYGKGFLYFDNGQLIDAFYKNTNGEAAARKILGWNGVSLQFSSLRRRKRRKNLNIDVMALAGAEWENDRTKGARVEIQPEAIPAPAEQAAYISEKELESCFFGDAANREWGAA